MQKPRSQSVQSFLPTLEANAFSCIGYYERAKFDGVLRTTRSVSTAAYRPTGQLASPRAIFQPTALRK